MLSDQDVGSSFQHVGCRTSYTGGSWSISVLTAGAGLVQSSLCWCAECLCSANDEVVVSVLNKQRDRNTSGLIH